MLTRCKNALILIIPSHLMKLWPLWYVVEKKCNIVLILW